MTCSVRPANPCTCSSSCNETRLPRPQQGALVAHLITIFGEKKHPHELLGELPVWLQAVGGNLTPLSQLGLQAFV